MHDLVDSARAAAHRARSERFNYRDQALSPVDHHEEETFDYLTKSDGAKGAIKHLKKAAELTQGARAETGRGRRKRERGRGGARSMTAPHPHC